MKKHHKRRNKTIDYVERGHMMGAKPPKYMCTECFNIFSKRSEGDGQTQKCKCGNEELVPLDPCIPIPRKKAKNDKKWLEFFTKNFMSTKANLYYQKFKNIKKSTIAG